MRIVPERSPWMQLLTVLLAFVSGPLLALRLAQALTPGSDLVETVGPFAFMIVFMVGTLVWGGWGFLVVVARGLAQLIRGRRPSIEGLGERDRVVPPGYSAYPVLGGIIGFAVGVLAALATPLDLLGGALAWLAAGLVYGAALWGAAHTGLLPFPEPE